MPSLRFVPQSQLDTWADQQVVEIEGATLRATAGDVSLILIPAAHFKALVEGEDKNGLVNKVKTDTYLREIGAEVVMDSCLVGETAYLVEPGFLAEETGSRESRDDERTGLV